MPFYHCFGMVPVNLMGPAGGGLRLDPLRALRPLGGAVGAERCTAIRGIPTKFIAELDQPHFDELDLGSLRAGIIPAPPVPLR